MKFTSQICTTCEQSERLLALGLKKETADMCWNKLTLHGTPVTYTSQDVWTNHSIISDSHFPAWSLHRLIEICPIVINNPPRFVEVSSFKTSLVSMTDKISDNFNRGKTYDNMIDCIERLIKEGHLNKDYLEEKQ